MNKKTTKFFILFNISMITSIPTLLPSISHARKVLKTDFTSVVDRSSIIISGKCLSYQCISYQKLMSLPLKKCKSLEAGVARLYTIKIDKVIFDKHNFLENNMISSLLKVKSNRSDNNSICNSNEKKSKNKLLYLSHHLRPQITVQPVLGNLLHQDLSNIKLVKKHLREILD